MLVFPNGMPSTLDNFTGRFQATNLIIMLSSLLGSGGCKLSRTSCGTLQSSFQCSQLWAIRAELADTGQMLLKAIRFQTWGGDEREAVGGWGVWSAHRSFQTARSQNQILTTGGRMSTIPWY
jgi:hypothetical protein